MPLLHIQIHSHPQKGLEQNKFLRIRSRKTIEILGVFGYGLKLPPKTAHSPFISAYKSQKYMQKVELEQSSRLFPYLKRVQPLLHSQLPHMGRLIYGYVKGAVFMPFYDSEAIERARQVDLLTYLQTCEPQELVHVSGNVYCTKTHDSLPDLQRQMVLVFPAGLAVTVRWTISSRSTAIPFWRPWKLSPEGLPSRRLPLCQRRRRKSPSTCFCPRPPRIIGR